MNPDDCHHWDLNKFSDAEPRKHRIQLELHLYYCNVLANYQSKWRGWHCMAYTSICLPLSIELVVCNCDWSSRTWASANPQSLTFSKRPPSVPLSHYVPHGQAFHSAVWGKNLQPFWTSVMYAAMFRFAKCSNKMKVSRTTTQSLKNLKILGNRCETWHRALALLLGVLGVRSSSPVPKETAPGLYLWHEVLVRDAVLNACLKLLTTPTQVCLAENLSPSLVWNLEKLVMKMKPIYLCSSKVKLFQALPADFCIAPLHFSAGTLQEMWINMVRFGQQAKRMSCLNLYPVGMLCVRILASPCSKAHWSCASPGLRSDLFD